jgi:hypothetical protein
MAPDVLRPPIVYLGPSLSHAEAAALLPGAELKGPIHRGDLYRDREAGGTVFLILDGVFFQREAVSPREVVDVARDGALVVGAASMGALRAAECWPAGMAGVGTIYRLFRRGALASDDEVAVTFSGEGGHPPFATSVALVNVRHAAARALRRGWMDRDLALRLVRTAEETYFPERLWPELLARAGAPPDLEARLAAWDLKQEDARRALRRVGRWLAADPSLGRRPRRSEAAFTASEQVRERDHDALASAGALGGPQDLGEARRGLAQWHLVSGRGASHLLAVAAAHPELGLLERRGRKEALGPLLGALRPPLERDGLLGAASGLLSRPRLDAAFALRLALFELWGDLLSQHEQAFAEALWAELALAGELDAEILRWRAVRAAAAAARQQGLAARDRDRYLAEAEIAGAHGLPSWRDLREAVGSTACPWALFSSYRDQLALAKRFREELFNPRPAPRETPSPPGDRGCPSPR